MLLTPNLEKTLHRRGGAHRNLCHSLEISRILEIKRFMFIQKGGAAPRLFSCLSVEFARHFVLKRFQEHCGQNQNIEYGRKNNEKVSQSERVPKAGTLHISICGKSATTLVSSSEAANNILWWFSTKSAASVARITTQSKDGNDGLRRHAEFFSKRAGDFKTVNMS